LANSMSAESILVTPGDKIGGLSQFEAGQGCYSLAGFIFASLNGRLNLSKNSQAKPVLEVIAHHSIGNLPQVGDIVTCRVTKINARMASCEILCVGTTLLSTSLDGTIRSRDVRAHDIDSVVISKSFRPGDIVRAQVISLGDLRNYYLSTAKNELGVVLAFSAATSTSLFTSSSRNFDSPSDTSVSLAMVPISWNQMQCPATKVKEYRKVAKIE